MISLLKMNLKLLIRNKGFLFFLLVTPIISTIILSIKTDTAYTGGKQSQEIIELRDYNVRAVYKGDTSAFIVKVYDGSYSDLSEYMMNELAKKGLYSICRCDVRELTEEQVYEQAKKDAFDDRAGVLIYLKKSFEQAVLENRLEDGVRFYLVSEDKRLELFEADYKSLLRNISQAQVIVGADGGKIVAMLKKAEGSLPEKNIVSLAGESGIELSNQQINQKTIIGYSFAIITLGFLFCGVFVAHTVIEEKNNKVFTRVMISKVTSKEYFLSKFALAFVVAAMQTVVLAVCIFAISGIDFGINKFVFLLIVFLLGLIFSMLSLLVGVLLGDIMNSNYAIFAIWSVSALLAGLYFPLDDTTTAMKVISRLMPQKWFLNATEMLLVGDKSAYPMLLCITVAYLVFIISIGSVGLRMKKVDA
ncbi:MAG: ABC transporter permease [Lachnospiraceae bacterium]|nr:ABC transporter permease [Lachnospiraceae bacterium]